MIAHAPGKVVLSGAYSVLEGAPAIVAAVDRYVTADSARPAELVTREVAAAQGAGAIDAAPWFDASALRQNLPDGSSRKLGLGSSAAILVASLGAALGERAGDEAALRAQVLPIAWMAHRRAQGGGSGIDVAASVHGGIVRCLRDPSLPARPLQVDAHPLPPGVHIEVLASSVAAQTSDLLARVRAFAARDACAYQALMGAAKTHALSAVAARSATELVEAVRLQIDVLGELGRRAGAPIVTEEVAALMDVAAVEGAMFGPSGAGGGDIAVFIGAAPASAAFRERARAGGLYPLALRMGARGLHLAHSPRA